MTVRNFMLVICAAAVLASVGCGSGAPREDVYRVVNRLFLSTDLRDWPAVREVFADRVRFDMSSLTGQPAADLDPEEITASWEQGLAPLRAIHHQTGNYVIDVDGDRARAFCYGTATHFLPTRSGRNTRSFVGSYHFELARSAGVWKINSFRFNFKYMDGNPNLEQEAL